MPSEKITHSKKKLIVVHLSEKWINYYYSEDDFLDLISLLTKENFSIVLTTDNSTKNKFKKIYEKYDIVSEKNFKELKSTSNHIVILDNLDYRGILLFCKLSPIHSYKEVRSVLKESMHLQEAVMD